MEHEAFYMLELQSHDWRITWYAGLKRLRRWRRWGIWPRAPSWSHSINHCIFLPSKMSFPGLKSWGLRYTGLEMAVFWASLQKNEGSIWWWPQSDSRQRVWIFRNEYQFVLGLVIKQTKAWKTMKLTISAIKSISSVIYKKNLNEMLPNFPFNRYFRLTGLSSIKPGGKIFQRFKIGRL